MNQPIIIRPTRVQQCYEYEMLCKLTEHDVRKRNCDLTGQATGHWRHQINGLRWRMQISRRCMLSSSRCATRCSSLYSLRYKLVTFNLRRQTIFERCPENLLRRRVQALAIQSMPAARSIYCWYASNGTSQYSNVYIHPPKLQTKRLALTVQIENLLTPP
jgi:hypothetical protein